MDICPWNSGTEIGTLQTHTKNKCLHIEAETNVRHFADDIFKCICLNENVWISIKISLTFVPTGSNNNIAALVLIMAWRRPWDKPLSEWMMVNLLTHICVTQLQWVINKGLYQHLLSNLLTLNTFIDKTSIPQHSNFVGWGYKNVWIKVLNVNKVLLKGFNKNTF